MDIYRGHRGSFIGGRVCASGPQRPSSPHSLFQGRVSHSRRMRQVQNNQGGMLRGRNLPEFTRILTQIRDAIPTSTPKTPQQSSKHQSPFVPRRLRHNSSYVPQTHSDPSHAWRARFRNRTKNNQVRRQVFPVSCGRCQVRILLL